MKILYLLSVLILFASCSSEKNEKSNTSSPQDTVSVDTTDIVKNLDTNDTVQPVSLSFEDKIQNLKSCYLKSYDEINKKDKGIHALQNSNTTFHQAVFLKKKTSINYGDVEDIYPVVNLFFYEYSTEDDCQKAFIKWLECFGGECDQITVGTNMDHIKMPPMYIIKNATEIIVLKYLCEHNENNWADLKNDLLSSFKTPGSKIMNVECGGPLTWISD